MNADVDWRELDRQWGRRFRSEVKRAERAEARLAAIKALCESAARQGAPYSVGCDDVLALIEAEA